MDKDYQRTKPSVSSFTLSPCYIYIIFFSCTMRLVFTFLLHNDYSTSTPNLENPTWCRPKGWNASRVTPDKITTVKQCFCMLNFMLNFFFLHTSPTASIVQLLPQLVPHTTMLTIDQYNTTIKYNACVGPTTYFIYYTHHQNTHCFFRLASACETSKWVSEISAKIISKPTFLLFQNTLTSDALYEITTRNKQRIYSKQIS